MNKPGKRLISGLLAAILVGTAPGGGFYTAWGQTVRATPTPGFSAPAPLVLPSFGPDLGPVSGPSLGALELDLSLGLDLGADPRLAEVPPGPQMLAPDQVFEKTPLGPASSASLRYITQGKTPGANAARAARAFDGMLIPSRMAADAVTAPETSPSVEAAPAPAAARFKPSVPARLRDAVTREERGSFEPMLFAAVFAPVAAFLLHGAAKLLRSNPDKAWEKLVADVVAAPDREGIEKRGDMQRHIWRRERTEALDANTSRKDVFDVIGGTRLNALGKPEPYMVRITQTRRQRTSVGDVHEVTTTFEYGLHGSPMDGRQTARLWRGIDGRWKVISEGKNVKFRESSYDHNGKHVHENVRAAWAPVIKRRRLVNATLVTAVAAGVTFLFALTAVSPWMPIAAAAAAGLLGFWMARFIDGKDAGVALGLLMLIALPVAYGAMLAFGPAGLIAAPIGLMAGVTAGIDVAQGDPRTPLVAPPGPRARVGHLARLRIMLAGLVVAFAMGQAYLPSPVNATLMEKTAAYVEANAEGAAYAEYIREAQDVPTYISEPWHSNYMGEGNLGLHVPGNKMSPDKIFLQGRGLSRDLSLEENLQLAAPVAIHEFDHNKQRQTLDPAPHVLDNEVSAWDYETRFLFHELERNPRLFEELDVTLYQRNHIRQMQEWLKGPESFTAWVKDHDSYRDLPTIEDFAAKYKGTQHEAWAENALKHYQDHRADMQAAWERYSQDAELVAKVEAAAKAFDLKAEAKRRTDGPPAGLLWRLLLGQLAALGAIFGLVRSKRRRVSGPARAANVPESLKRLGSGALGAALAVGALAFAGAFTPLAATVLGGGAFVLGMAARHDLVSKTVPRALSWGFVLAGLAAAGVNPLFGGTPVGNLLYALAGSGVGLAAAAGLDAASRKAYRERLGKADYVLLAGIGLWAGPLGAAGVTALALAAAYTAHVAGAGTRALAPWLMAAGIALLFFL